MTGVQTCALPIFIILVVMVPLYLMATPALREFVLPLMVGVIVGCLSSIFMCSPIYYDLSHRKHSSKYEKMIAEAEKQKKRESSNNASGNAANKKTGKKQSRAKRKHPQKKDK